MMSNHECFIFHRINYQSSILGYIYCLESKEKKKNRGQINKYKGYFTFYGSYLLDVLGRLAMLSELINSN